VSGDDTTDENTSSGLIQVATELLGSLSKSLPAVVVKNAIKAVSRLSSAAVSVPEEWLKGIATETRARSQARVRLIRVSSNQLAEQMRTDPAYAHAAANKYAEKIIRERLNLDQITDVALTALQASPESPANAAPESEPISDDWLNVFESEAANMSSESMQKLFGRILAGEIRRPSSYSIKTIKLMAQLDNRAAILFRLFCSLSLSLRDPRTNEVLDARVVSLQGNAAQNSLKVYGLPFDSLNTLHEYALIIPDYNSYGHYEVAMARDMTTRLPLSYAGGKWGLVPKGGANTTNGLKLHGVALSRSGKEILPIVDIEPNEGYTGALNTYFDSLGFILTPASLIVKYSGVDQTL